MWKWWHMYKHGRWVHLCMWKWIYGNRVWNRYVDIQFEVRHIQFMWLISHNMAFRCRCLFLLMKMFFFIVDINECESNPCENGGTCTDMEDGYGCECKSGFTGLQCETGNLPFFLKKNLCVVFYHHSIVIMQIQGMVILFKCSSKVRYDKYR